MKLAEELYRIPVAPEHHLKMTYEQLNACDMDFDFISVLQDGKDFHKITRDICISYQKFHSGHLTNLFFSRKVPVLLDLGDSELISYYSDYIELRYIISGCLEVEIEGETAHFTENEICFINSMAYHRESIKNSECLLVNISIDREVFGEAFLGNVSMTPLQQFLRKNIMKYSDLQHYLKFTPTGQERLSLIQDYLFHIVSEIRAKQPGYMDISKGYLIRLMDELSSGYQYNFSRQESALYAEKLFESVTEFMKSNLSTIQMSALTKAFHFQPNYFNNLIKKQTGMTYSEYLVYLRIERAKLLLESSDLNVEEIMWMVGYHNKGFFYKKFTEITGLSPAKYRRNTAGQANAGSTKAAPQTDIKRNGDR